MHVHVHVHVPRGRTPADMANCATSALVAAIAVVAAAAALRAWPLQLPVVPPCVPEAVSAAALAAAERHLHAVLELRVATVAQAAGRAADTAALDAAIGQLARSLGPRRRCTSELVLYNAASSRGGCGDGEDEDEGGGADEDTAAEDGPERATLRQLLAGAAPGAPEETAAGGVTALHAAAHGGAHGVVEALLAAGVQVSAKTKRGATAVMHAAAHWRSAGGVRHKLNADPQLERQPGASDPFALIVDALLRAGADPDIKGGRPPKSARQRAMIFDEGGSHAAVRAVLDAWT